MVRPVALGDEARVGALVEAALLEADRERVHGVGRLLRRERGEHGRVDAAREQHADRDVRRADARARSRAAARGAPRRARPRRLRAARRPAPGRDARSGRSRRRRAPSRRAHDPAGSLRVSRKIEYGAGIELNARNASSASRSISPRGSARSSDANSSVAAGVAVVERLDPVAVARQHEPPRARVPDRDREHPAQPPDVLRAVTLVEVEMDLGVAVRPEAVARRARARAAAPGSCRSRRSGRRRTSRPSLVIGWSPPARSMIESRRAASATGPSTYSPPLSGPRWTSVALIAASRSASAAPYRDAIPQIPHIEPSLWTARGGLPRCGRERRRGRLAMHAAPDEPRLPAGEPRLVDELEVEERMHVGLAGREPDRRAELRRLLRGADRLARSRVRSSGCAAAVEPSTGSRPRDTRCPACRPNASRKTATSRA